eukprot:scaffold268415_cov18-Tisochrysis_lutea.AAC.1
MAMSIPLHTNGPSALSLALPVELNGALEISALKLTSRRVQRCAHIWNELELWEIFDGGPPPTTSTAGCRDHD